MGIALHEDGLGLAVQSTVERLFEELRRDSADLERLDQLEQIVELARSLAVRGRLLEGAEWLLPMLVQLLPARRREADGGFDDAARWVERFRALGEKLSVKVDAPARVEPP